VSELQPPAGSPVGVDPGTAAAGGSIGPPDGPAGAEADRPGPRGKRSRRAIIEWGSILVVAVVAALVLRSFVIQPYFIPSGSMFPTLKVGDKVLVDKLSYHMHGVHRGDVIVFKKPPNDYTPDIKDLIKRIVGLPNETISASGGNVYIDGKVLRQPWLPKGVTTTFPSSQIPGCLPAPAGACHIPPGDYFVMGDNRGNSADSRVIGPIAGNLIVGRAFLIVWPVSRIGTL
jgi:signal peptidase I